MKQKFVFLARERNVCSTTEEYFQRDHCLAAACLRGPPPDCAPEARVVRPLPAVMTPAAFCLGPPGHLQGKGRIGEVSAKRPIYGKYRRMHGEGFTPVRQDTAMYVNYLAEDLPPTPTRAKVLLVLLRTAGRLFTNYPEEIRQAFSATGLFKVIFKYDFFNSSTLSLHRRQRTTRQAVPVCVFTWAVQYDTHTHLKTWVCAGV